LYTLLNCTCWWDEVYKVDLDILRNSIYCTQCLIYYLHLIPPAVTFSNAVSKLKTQSSNVSFHWNEAKERGKRDFRACILECHRRWYRMYKRQSAKFLNLSRPQKGRKEFSKISSLLDLPYKTCTMLILENSQISLFGKFLCHAKEHTICLVKCPVHRGNVWIHHKGTMQHTATHCNTLRHAATHCKTLQHTATHCNTLQHTICLVKCPVHRGNVWIHHKGTLQHTATHTATRCNTLQHAATHCKTLQHTATHCNTLQHSATHCNTLQHTATHCNTRSA